MKISVCLASYNGEQFIVRQLDSVVKQLKKDDQIVVVDDGSNDNTVQLLKETYGNRIELYINEKNLGPIKSFEKAISLAKGDIIFLCDQDDIWEDNKVQKVLECVREEDASLVIHDAYVVDSGLKEINPSWNEYNNNHSKGIVANIIKNSATGACMAFTRELVPSILPFPKSIEMHDQWIALVCMKRQKKLVYLKDRLIKYVRHGSNVTGMKKRTLNQQVKGRLGVIKAIITYK
ncbi:glycosyltransferase family 2 protein [Robertmurraya korlensis]|uniref:glycosyltransferase family 2 protein n=1 Tax=Robertmurraya korlensis TaxID=519977 RepID=UPI000826F1D2|nr:glycosyltransferase family 2 protein [Robertmurraya korlensis]